MTVSSNTAAPRLGRRERYDPKVVAAAFILIAPTIIGLCILNIWPFFDTIRRSLYRTQGLGPEVYIGLKNFEKLFSDSMIGNATVNTLLYMVLTVPVGVLLSLIFASLLNSRIRGRDLYRGIYFLPMVVAPAAVAMVWRWVFNAENGILNISLKAIGIQGPSWLADPNTALVSCAVIGIWSAVGYDLVLILAGLQSISKSYYEAAEIDGASGMQSFFHITIPMVSPTLFFVVLMRAILKLERNGSFKIQDCVGQTASVYLRIPASHSASGKVQISINGSVHELTAFTDGEALPTGARVKVVKVIDSGSLLVERI